LIHEFQNEVLAYNWPLHDSQVYFGLYYIGSAPAWMQDKIWKPNVKKVGMEKLEEV